MVMYSPDNESFAPIKWRRRHAPNGRGQILSGPDEHSARLGAMVIAPPGVLLRAPEGSEPLTWQGWRQARWGADEEGRVLIDQARPLCLLEVSLEQVVTDLAEWAPEHLLWVASVVERGIRILIGRMPRDCSGRPHPRAATAFDELLETRRRADDAFGKLRDHPCEVSSWLIDRPFLRMERTFVAELNADRERHKEAMRSADRKVVGYQRHLRLVTDLDRFASNKPLDPS
jgi:hypothetical protein